MSFQVPQSGAAVFGPSTDAACLAHDQNNLLQAVFCMVQALQPRLLADAFASQKLEELNRALEGIARMNESVLKCFHNARCEVAAIAEGCGEVFDSPDAGAAVDPDQVIEWTVALARIIAAEDIRIDLRLSADGARLTIPEIHLQQVVYNLVKNGIEAAPEGGCVVVESSIQLRGGRDLARDKRQALRVSITDNGPGIPKEIGARVFECGYTSKTEGDGLGLHHARKILRMYGGSITMESCHPCGTRVTILWPFESVCRA